MFVCCSCSIMCFGISHIFDSFSSKESVLGFISDKTLSKIKLPLTKWWCSIIYYNLSTASNYNFIRLNSSVFSFFRQFVHAPSLQYTLDFLMVYTANSSCSGISSILNYFSAWLESIAVLNASYSLNFNFVTMVSTYLAESSWSEIEMSFNDVTKFKAKD